jgi:integrase
MNKKRYPKSEECKVKFETELGIVTKEFSPDDIAAMSAAGMSPDQISNTINANPLATHQISVSTPTLQPAQLAKPKGIGLSALIERYNNDRIAKKGGKWPIPKGDIAKQRRLIEILGDIDITQVEPEHAEDVRGKIMLLPANTARFRGQTVEQILNKKHEKTMSLKTVKDHIDHYTVIFHWARTKRLYKEANPFTDVAPEDGRPKHECRDPFTTQELSKIFAGEMFTRFSHKKYKDHHYWAPLIALYTGMRNAEIGGLHSDDIHVVEGTEDNPIYVFSIHTHDGLIRVKSKNAIRCVPVHPKLIELGLLKYRDNIAQKGNSRLFPYLKWEEASGYGRYIGEDFNNYLKKLGLHVPRKKVFYSFRHTLATVLERAEVRDARIEQISGRVSNEKKTTGRTNYITPAEAQYLLADLMKVNFDKVLSKVKPFK